MNDQNECLIVTAGPSLTEEDRAMFPQVTFRPPVAEGDLIRIAATHQPRAIGIVDGFFEDRLAVFHKEILWAMAGGITVFGAASMGALRAAELDSYGMIGVGEVYRGYRAGRLIDDGDVAIVHGPEEFGFKPLTVAYVDVEATVSGLLTRKRFSQETADDVLSAARSLNFRWRTWSSIAAVACNSPHEEVALARELEVGHVERKRLDALEMLHQMTVRRIGPPPANAFWPPQTAAFQQSLDRAVQEITG